MYGTAHHRDGQGSLARIPQLLEQLKADFEAVAHEVGVFKMQRDDYERKLDAQLAEVNNIQHTLHDLERNHTKIKQQFEEEVIRLRKELQSGSAGGATDFAATNNPSSSSFHHHPQAPVPSSVPPPPPPVTQGTAPSYLATSLPPLGGDKRSYAGVNSGPPLPANPIAKRPRPEGAEGAPFFSPSRLQAQTPAQPLPLPLPSQPPSATMGVSIHALSTPSSAPMTLATKEGLDTSHFSSPSILRDASEAEGTNGVGGALDTCPTAAAWRPRPPTQQDSEVKANTTVTSEPKPNSDPLPALDDGLGKREENDWLVIPNPSAPPNLSVNLTHTLDHQSVVCCVRFSNDGKYLATGCNRTAQIYDAATGEKVSIFADDTVSESREDSYVRSVCFSPDGNYLVAGAEDRTVRVWDVQKKTIRHRLQGHELDIYSLDFSRDGRIIVSGSGDRKTKIWDMERGLLLHTLGCEEVGPRDGVTSVALSPDGRLVACGSLDKLVRLWDVQTGQFLERFDGHADSVYSVAFSPDGSTLASGSLDKTLKLWDLRAQHPRCQTTFTGHKDFVLSVAFSPDGNWLISGSKDRSVQFWDPRTALAHLMLQGHKNSIISVSPSPAGGLLATGSGDFRARVWSTSHTVGESRRF